MLYDRAGVSLIAATRRKGPFGRSEKKKTDLTIKPADKGELE